jgi:hypothetical protein
VLDRAPIALSWLLVAFIGSWIAHSAEYVRVYGSRGIRRELVGSAHLYMGPLGLVLLGLFSVAALRWHQQGRRLGDRLHRGQAALRGARRRDTDRAPIDQGAPPSSLGHEWLGLLTGQIVIYFVQENIEALRATGRSPGFGVLTGAHWAAPLIHAGVALLLAAGLVVVHRRRARLLSDVSIVERLVARLWPRRPAVCLVPVTCEVAVTPLQRWGRQRWQRPPPAGALRPAFC